MVKKYKPVVDPNQKVDYASTNVPTTYTCGKCKTSGVKLWREYNTMLDYQTLLCAKCACKSEKKDYAKMSDDGCIVNFLGGKTDQIGMRMPAVPTEDNSSFWGYTSVPENGVKWWKRLPIEIKK